MLLLLADVTTSFLLIIMLFVISFNLLFGVVKVRSPQMSFSLLGALWYWGLEDDH